MTASADTRATLEDAVAELRDLPYSFWLEVAQDAASFSRPLTTGRGRLEIGARRRGGSEDIQVTITLKRGWRPGVADGFIITPTNEFR